MTSAMNVMTTLTNDFLSVLIFTLKENQIKLINIPMKFIYINLSINQQIKFKNQ